MNAKSHLLARIGVCLGCIAAASAFAAFQPATPKSAEGPATPVRNVAQWDLDGKGHLAINGYDPVAYFPEGGGKPAKGAKEHEYVHDGVTYRFASAEHLALFKQNPSKYEPAHGGWCSYAMWKSGEKVEVDPESFIVKDDRLFLFYDGWGGDTRKKWLSAGDHASQAAAADAAWKKISGESPRLAPTVQQLLDAKKAEFEKKAPSEVQALYEKGIKDVGASGVMSSALKVGVPAPEFELPDATGKKVSLASVLKDGAAVLVWYRGGWCPYCNIQLREYQKHLEEFTKAGGKLIAISPQTPDQSLSTKEKQGLEFIVLSDSGNVVARKFGIVYKLPKEVSEAFKGKLDLEKYNGDTSEELPLAVVYVVGRSGKIVYAFVDEDYRKRANIEDIVKALEADRPK
jgi:peroxiredoxin/YHS domain-containing protein